MWVRRRRYPQLPLFGFISFCSKSSITIGPSCHHRLVESTKSLLIPLGQSMPTIVACVRCYLARSTKSCHHHLLHQPSPRYSTPPFGTICRQSVAVVTTVNGTLLLPYFILGKILVFFRFSWLDLIYPLSVGLILCALNFKLWFRLFLEKFWSRKQVV